MYKICTPLSTGFVDNLVGENLTSRLESALGADFGAARYAPCETAGGGQWGAG